MKFEVPRPGRETAAAHWHKSIDGAKDCPRQAHSERQIAASAIQYILDDMELLSKAAAAEKDRCLEAVNAM
jgi:hypothetical protein